MRDATDSLFPPIVTPRLVLRRLLPEDAAAVAAYRKDPAVARYQTWTPENAEEVRSWLESIRELCPGAPGEWLAIAITGGGDGRVLGDCAIHVLVEEPRHAEIGVTLARENQGRGLAKEALTALLGYAFEALGMHRVIARIDPGNAPAIALVEALGMRREGHLRESTWVRGAWADDLLFAMLDREWAGRSGR